MAAPLWRVDSGEGGAVWLFADQATASRSWLDAEVAAAVDRASVLWLEVPPDIDVATNPLLPELGFMVQGDLERSLGPDRWTRAQRMAESVDVDLRAWRTMRPWLAAQMIDHAFMALHGADRHRPAAVLAEHAQLQTEFTADETLRFFAAFPTEAELAFVDTVLERAEVGRGGFDAESSAWLAGDLHLCDAYMDRIRSRSEALYVLMGAERNRAWVPRIGAALAAGEEHFVVVGFGHLVGGDRIQVHCEAQGLEVTRIQ